MKENRFISTDLMDFIFTEEKFDPNQPRDNNGMWTDGGSFGERWNKHNAKIQADLHNSLDKSIRGSTFTMDGENLAFTPNYSVGMFPEASDTIKGAVVTAKDIKDYIETNKKYFTAAGKIRSVGTWYDKDENVVWLDIAEIFTDRDKAIAAGIANNQKAIFDLSIMDEIPTGGTGKNRKASTDKPKPGSKEYAEGMKRFLAYMKGKK